LIRYLHLLLLLHYHLPTSQFLLLSF
jgi:hypothetical protein